MYHYRVRSRDAAGNLTVSADATFTTAARRARDLLVRQSAAAAIADRRNERDLLSNVTQLLSSLANLQSGQTLSLSAGLCDLSGATDALYVPQGITDWMICGATGDRDDVVIRGDGMDGSVSFGIWIGDSPKGTVADLTIDGVNDHGIMANIRLTTTCSYTTCASSIPAISS